MVRLCLDMEVAGPGLVFWWDGGAEVESFMGDGVRDAEVEGVEHESAGVGFLFIGVCVDGVCDDGCSDVEHVDTDLVGATCV